MLLYIPWCSTENRSVLTPPGLVEMRIDFLKSKSFTHMGTVTLSQRGKCCREYVRQCPAANRLHIPQWTILRHIVPSSKTQPSYCVRPPGTQHAGFSCCIIHSKLWVLRQREPGCVQRLSPWKHCQGTKAKGIAEVDFCYFQITVSWM